MTIGIAEILFAYRVPTQAPAHDVHTATSTTTEQKHAATVSTEATTQALPPIPQLIKSAQQQ
jgi:hypothetical protein